MPALMFDPQFRMIDGFFGPLKVSPCRKPEGPHLLKSNDSWNATMRWPFAFRILPQSGLAHAAW
jgi:hypothetical protein